ncbi:MAG TPA: hypothetical protein VGO00_18600 [Kofleriaceae bacterium]|nr:hypothetical protein [Kofleriaceae bacterium]
MVKLLVGILKGAIIGGAVGYGAYALELTGGFDWLTYGVVGLLVGLLVGRPVWSLIKDKNATNVIAILKAAFGFGVGCGLYAIVAKAWGGGSLMIAGHNAFDWQPTLGGAIGAIYGGFVELDDAIGDDTKSNKDGSKARPKKQLPDA